MLCVYHSADLDGHCSGAIVGRHFKGDCEFLGMDYGKEFDWHKLNEHDKIVMVDFSLPPDEMSKIHAWSLEKSWREFIWIDHHKTAIEAIDNTIKGSREIGCAACELAWEYFNREAIPETVRLLGRYDVWDHEDPKVLPFQFGARLYVTAPERNLDFWENWFCSFPQKVLDEGITVLRYIKQDNAKYVSACAFETELKGHRCIAVNKALANSQTFDSIWDEDKYDVMLTFSRKKGFWTISLYTTKDSVDVSAIAKELGGGGHKNAAGFTCDVLPFSLG